MKVQGRCMEHMVVKAPAAMKIAFGENPKVNYGEKDIMPGSRMGFSNNPMEVFTRTLYTIINGKVVYQEDNRNCFT